MALNYICNIQLTIFNFLFSVESDDDFNACNNIRDVYYNTDIINSIANLIVHTPVGKPV